MAGRKERFEIGGYSILWVDDQIMVDSPNDTVRKIAERLTKGKVDSMSGSDFCRAHWQVPDVLKTRRAHAVGVIMLRGEGDSWEDALGKFVGFEVAVRLQRNGKKVWGTVLVPPEDMRRQVGDVWRDGNERLIMVDGVKV